ncbi:MAG: DNA adenine methylase [Bryobacteraceae bacterium]|nr:DNA adenine methylase [Bryobacteraceae bacterium]
MAFHPQFPLFEDRGRPEAQPQPSATPALELPLPPRAALYPQFRYMGSKHRLLPWIHAVLDRLDFESAADPFVGSGCVAYLMKAMGKQVTASDFLNFPVVLAEAAIANDAQTLGPTAVKRLLASSNSGPGFIETTFSGIFYGPEDLRFLDRVTTNVQELKHPHQRSLAMAALIRSCLKKQPRGVFTVSGDLSRYDDGRRDLQISLEQHFVEQVEVFNRVVFSNGKSNSAFRADVFTESPALPDLVYLDPPYVPRSDDNCYMKRYHFLEGLSCRWRGVRILEKTKVKKLEKPYTPFSYRKSAESAFDQLFARYRHSIIVLSYSSNGYPDLDRLTALLGRYKRNIQVHQRPHRYHFGTHSAVERAQTSEYLIVGQ